MGADWSGTILAMAIKRVCVYAASSRQCDAEYHDAAARLGRELARNKVTLVYGGGSVGSMGHMADAALAEGGRVIGVLPRFMYDLEWGHPRIERAAHRKRLARAQTHDDRGSRCGDRAAGRMRHARGVVRSNHLEAARALWRTDRAGQYARLLHTVREVPRKLHRASVHGRAPSRDVVVGRAARGCARRDRERAAVAA